MSNSSFSILSNQPPLDHEGFAAHRELEAILKKNVRGEVRFDLGSRRSLRNRLLELPAASGGRRFSAGRGDVEAALAACWAEGAAVLPRGAGTSLAGQCANVAVVFDYSRYMNGLTYIDPAEKIAVVEPGIVLDRLRDAAEEYHLTYAPDPATHSRCTLGGMIGNNSCGVHGLLGGKVVDNVESLDVILYDGTRLHVGETTEEELEAKIAAGDREGEIYAGLKRIRDKYSQLVREKFPRIPRRVSGYNLDELLPENNFNVARALVGSEGTCVNIVSATLNLTASPPFRVLTVLGFADPFLAADAVPLALEHHPIGLEGFDHLLVDFMRRKGLNLRDLSELPSGVSFLLVELGAWSAEEARAQAEKLALACQAGRCGRWHASAPVKKQSAFGACATRHWGPWCLFPGARPARGLGGRGSPAGEAGRLSARHHRIDGRIRLQEPALRYLWQVRRTCASVSLPDRGRTNEVSRIYYAGSGCGDQFWRIAFRRTWRRTIACGAAAQNVWHGADGGFPRVQDAV